MGASTRFISGVRYHMSPTEVKPGCCGKKRTSVDPFWQISCHILPKCKQKAYPDVNL